MPPRRSSMTMLKTNQLLTSALLIWSVTQHAIDGRYVNADDFSTLAAEVAAMKEERIEFNGRITELEMKVSAGEAKIKAVEETLSTTETNLASTAEKLRIVEGKLNDALSRIDELEQKSYQNYEEEITESKADNAESDRPSGADNAESDRPSGADNAESDHPSGGENEITTETHMQRKAVIRDRTAQDSRQSISKRIVPTSTRHVAFSVYLSGDLKNLGTHHTIAFDGVRLNEGNAFDTVMSVFICPVSGVYMFQSALMAESHDFVITEIVKDGAGLVKMHAEGNNDANGYDQGFNSVITACTEGEHVWVRANWGNAVDGEAYTTFSGYLLWES